MVYDFKISSWLSSSWVFAADKVFGPASLTETVYEEGVKNVALSALMGINGSTYPLIHLSWLTYGFISELNNHFIISYNAATIFAYGQTSSGKTYTMRGITEKAVNDIYRHIMNVSFYQNLMLLFPLFWTLAEKSSPAA